MTRKDYAIVALPGGTVTSVMLSKFDATKMHLFEECDEGHVAEKTAYWDRIYHYKTPDPSEETKLKYHFYNSKRDLHLWTSDCRMLRRVRYPKEYKLID